MTFRTSIVSLFLLSAIVSPLLAASGNVEKEGVCLHDAGHGSGKTRDSNPV